MKREFDSGQIFPDISHPLPYTSMYKSRHPAFQGLSLKRLTSHDGIIDDLWLSNLITFGAVLLHKYPLETQLCFLILCSLFFFFFLKNCLSRYPVLLGASIKQALDLYHTWNHTCFLEQGPRELQAFLGPVVSTVYSSLYQVHHNSMCLFLGVHFQGRVMRPRNFLNDSQGLTVTTAECWTGKVAQNTMRMSVAQTIAYHKMLIFISHVSWLLRPPEWDRKL